MQIDVLKIIDELREETLKTYKGGAKLVIIQVGDNPASNLYVKSKLKELPKWNVETELIKLTDSVTTDNLLELIQKLNWESETNGIIVQLPLPEHIDEKKVLEQILPSKNVDGFKQNRGNAKFQPCTPKGIMHIINHEGGLENKIVTVIGRGKTVGEPLIDMLRKEPCTLICCNSHTEDFVLKSLLLRTEILISAVGKPNLFALKDLSSGTLIIDAGISRVDGKQVGDFSHDGLHDYVNYTDYINYTPWTNGVGKMTVSMLAVNTIEAYKLQHTSQMSKAMDRIRL